MKIFHMLLIAFFSICVSQPARANIVINFDYRYDNGFFTGANSYRQATLDAAASVFETRIQDTLTAITSTTQASYNASFWQPVTGNIATLNSFSVEADSLTVFVGAHNIGYALAQSGPGSGSYSGKGVTPAFIDNANGRGEPGALTYPATDFAPWGGSITFNDGYSWYTDTDTTTNEAFSGYDLFSVAMHELGHVLGFGSAASFNNLVVGGVFTGAAVNAEVGYSPSVTSGHWAYGTDAMRSGIAQGQRKPFTETDFAALKDIGWQVAALPEVVSPIPEGSTWAMMLAGLGLIGMMTLRRGAQWTSI